MLIALSQQQRSHERVSTSRYTHIASLIYTEALPLISVYRQLTV